MVRREALRDPWRVEFRPARAAGQAEPGEPLLRVALRLGVDVMTTCGARGRCTTCRVKLLEGRLSPPMPAEITQLGAEQVAEGFRLACQAEPRGDTVVLVSPPLIETAVQRAGR